MNALGINGMITLATYQNPAFVVFMEKQYV